MGGTGDLRDGTLHGMISPVSSWAVRYHDSYKELDESTHQGPLRNSLHKYGKDLSSTERAL